MIGRVNMLFFDEEAPALVQDFLQYLKTNLDHSDATISEYYSDLKTFFRFMLRDRGAAPADMPFNEIPIRDIGLEFIRHISKVDINNYVVYLRSERVYNEGRPNQGQGLAPASTNRKIACLKTFFNYLCNKVDLLEKNPTVGVASPLINHKLPSYLTQQEAFRLLDAVDGRNEARDYCILILFLNCGLRVSEIVNINLDDIRTGSGSNFLTITGKGNKQRQIYLEDACLDALEDYIAIRESRYRPKEGHEKALFLSRLHLRMSVDAVQAMVKHTLLAAGLSPKKYSAHKLRHTAATLMLQNGVDVRTLQEILGHENLNTTQIYTHVDSDSLRVAAKANPLSKPRKRRRN